ncbi:hypothetical protein Tco_0051975 [Tanacetum coccineum]
MKHDQLAQFRFNSLTEEAGWNRIEEYAQYQDDLWDDPLPSMNVSSISEAYATNRAGGVWVETQRKEKGKDGPEWVVRNKFEDELVNFMLEKKFYTKGIGEMIDKHRKEMHEQFSQILSTIRESKFLEPEAPTFAITTRSRIST